ncbi:unnamed protein product [Ilex paraguariensis]|uniref:Zinc-ribbon domain-containing protein n=1 Tax=Ilex paraguariensis TaxID=185542 RepID=A0ABC8RDZ3_9AQUA
MAEASKFRLVRCPKCENLPPELPDISVYQCGGCGAVLRTTNKGPVNVTLSKQSENEMVRGGSEKEAVSFGRVIETQGESDQLELRKTRERISHERVDDIKGSSSPRTENREVLIDSDRTRRGETMGLRPDQFNKVESYDNDEYRRPSNVSNDNWVRRNNPNLGMNRHEYVDSSVENELGKIRHRPIGSLRSQGNDVDLNLDRPEYVNFSVEDELERVRLPVGSLRSRPIMDQWSIGRNGSTAFHGNAIGVAEHRRFASFPHPEEGPSNYWPGSFCGYGEQLRNGDGFDGLARVENLENNRAELLRKLGQLKDQLSRSSDVAEKRKERVAVDRRMAPPPPDPYAGYGAFIPEGSTNLYGVDMQPIAIDRNVPAPYFDHYRGPLPYTSSHGLDMQDFYAASSNAPNEFLGHEDVYRSQMLRRPANQPLFQYLQGPFHDNFAVQHTDFNQDALASQPHETFCHQSACSCLHCSKRSWHVPPKVPPPVFSNRKLPNETNDHIFYGRVNDVTYSPQGYHSEYYSPQGYHPEYSNPLQLHPWDQQPHTKSSNDLDSENGGFGFSHPRMVVVAHGSEQFLCPVAGGAPLVTCCNCFELLKLPMKLMVVGKKQRKLRCGTCSSIILFKFENKRLVVSVPTPIKQVSSDVDDDSIEKMQNENLQNSHGYRNVSSSTSCSNDYGNFDYNFQLSNEPKLLSRDRRSNISESEDRQGPRSSSSSFSNDEQSPDSVIVQKDVSDSALLPSKEDVPSHFPDSPLQEQPDYSSTNEVASRYVKNKKTLRTDQDKVILDRTTYRQNSAKDAPVATEMEDPFNDFSTSVVSQDSVEMSKEEDRPRTNKGGESFFAGLIKKRYREFSRSSQGSENGRSNVFVNGQLIPDCVVKKAEKLAGPIEPGEYWYDFRAGFWGVKGQACLGIIPPLIEEFNYPMPENCAAGNTEILVNGRELHQKDLDLLAGRGLPITKHRSYLIEFSGRVLDERTGEELDSLGKLAPT